ncbi:MAG TPA: lipid A biosynthesis acyltransferase [Ramlibacter sp.]|jgi:KDO2-lipid IV(A) lauroyltransferase|uniref:LpxL/LpxP family acyltransferase n=1 Tax=Ramlibacter sp. TaxID=1917967 RepID=UPI002D4E876A|nr:lipid A biosynthesis acyltransferase [Ramlibacter sp.]HZY18901.1 lipid A biosynthesis acyltransferase [Ramlibacter sp.]
MLSRLGVVFMRLLAPLPLRWVRALGWLLGWVLYLVVAKRRHVVKVNLDLCYPQWTEQERRALVPRVFIAFAQAWLDRSWIWHGRPDVVRDRVKLTGALSELEGREPTVIFWPHFVGMDAGWTALTLDSERPFMTIYTHQANPVVDAWILAGRQRFGQVRLFRRADGVKAVISALREGTPLCLLPDMNFGAEESIFVPFYGVPAATVPSLSRFARLGRAKVVPLLTRITPGGYDVQVLPAWRDYPTDDLEADTALMNERLQDYIDGMPEQYYWVHKRFKTRPPGDRPVY